MVVLGSGRPTRPSSIPSGDEFPGVLPGALFIGTVAGGTVHWNSVGADFPRGSTVVLWCAHHRRVLPEDLGSRRLSLSIRLIRSSLRTGDVCVVLRACGVSCA